jgi:hypothetical protein
LTQALGKAVPAATTFSKVNSRAATQLKQQQAVGAATAGSTGARRLLDRILLAKGGFKGDDASLGTRGVVDSKASALRAAATAPDTRMAQLLLRSEARMTSNLKALVGANVQQSGVTQPEKASGIDQGIVRMPKL